MTTATPVGWGPIRFPWERGRWEAAEREVQQLRRRVAESEGRGTGATVVTDAEFERTRTQALALLRRHRRLYGLWHYRFRRWVRRPFVAFVALIPRVGEQIARWMVRPSYPLELVAERRAALQAQILSQLITTAMEAGDLDSRMDAAGVARARLQARHLPDHSEDVISLCDPSTPRRLREAVVSDMHLEAAGAGDLKVVLLEDVVMPPPSFDLADLVAPRLQP